MSDQKQFVLDAASVDKIIKTIGALMFNSIVQEHTLSRLQAEAAAPQKARRPAKAKAT